MNRIELVCFFDVQDGNPNGDPDMGNRPRIDERTGQGLVTDVCIKRKVRDYVMMSRGNESPYEIYVAHRINLNDQNKRAHDAVQSEKKDKIDDYTKWMCENFYDVRTFGAVMSTKVNCGKTTGPIQIGFSRSVNRLSYTNHTITRVASAEEGKTQNMGGKYTVDYGLYKMEVFYNPFYADRTGFTEQDFNLFIEALQNMFEFDHSASRAKMSMRKIVKFEHDSKLGNAPSQKLFDLIDVKQLTEDPRNYSDFEIIVNDCDFPGIKVDTWNWCD